MAGKNDILATAGVDLSAFEAGIAKLTSRLDAVEKAGSKAADGIDKVDKSASKLANIAVFDRFAQGLQMVANGGGETATALARLDQRASLGAVSEGADNLAAMNNIVGASIDTLAKVPGVYGAIASAGKGVIQGQIDQTVASNSANAELQKQAHTIDAVVAKEQNFIKIEHELYKARAANNDQDRDFIKAIDKARDVSSKKYEQQVNKELKAADNLSAGAELRLAAMDIEKQKKQEIANVTAQLTPTATTGGKRGEAAQRIIDAETKKIELRYKLKEREVATAQQQEKSEAALNEAASKRGVLIGDALEKQETERKELEKQLATAKTFYAEDSKQVSEKKKALQQNLLITREIEKTKDLSDADLITNEALSRRNVTLSSQLEIIDSQIGAEGKKLATLEKQAQVDKYAVARQKAAVQSALLQRQEFYYLNGKDLEQQKLITKQIDAQMAGNKKLAALAQIRAQFELQIADAIRQGNAPKAKELAKQQAAAELGARAEDLRKTPQQRAAERKEQAESNRLQKLVNAREKDRQDRKARGAYGQRDSNDFTSKAAEKARKEFADRNEKRILAAGNNALIQAQNFQAQVLNVQQLKNGQ